ncbi:hypothetical protein C5167_018612, partial [Papaver somniferum]
VSSPYSQLWKPSLDLGGPTAPISRYHNDFEEVSSLDSNPSTSSCRSHFFRLGFIGGSKASCSGKLTAVNGVGVRNTR